MVSLALFNQVAGAATVVSLAALVLIIILILIRQIPDWLSRHSLKLAFFISLASLLVSLLYSDVFGLAPCLLCWYQRIFMYPLVVLLGLGWWRREERGIAPYGLALGALGFLFALYHIYLQSVSNPLFICDPAAGISCTETYFTVFSFVTIPIMSAIAFAIVILLLKIRSLNK